MEIAFGHLRYTPATFWAMSLVEFNAAVTGYGEKVGGGSSTSDDCMTRSELEALMEAYPDGDRHSP